MPKVHKTRKQKIRSDQRQQRDSLPSISYSLPQQTINVSSVPQPKTQTITTQDYGHLSKDLWKTLLLTSAIIAAEILIKQFAFTN